MNRFLRLVALLAVPAACLLPGVVRAAEAQHGLSAPYIDPRYLTAVPFGAHSHWLQPWRAYQETVPAQRFLEAQGVVLDGDGSDNFDLICRMLAKCGVRHARIEVGWGGIDWDDETKINNIQDVRKKVLACKRNGIRPLILLNANSGAPGPTRFFDRVLAAPAHKGDRTVTLTDASGLTVGYSGIRNLTDYWASEALVTGVDGNTVTLSKPLPKDLGNAGAKAEMSTLKYRPFGSPDTADYGASREGWQRYACNVARAVAGILGRTGRNNLGFDMEIWNELSFGSWSLKLNAYYEHKVAEYNEEQVFADLVKATAETADAHPELFRGVRFVDGFRNTIPWPAASTEPARVTAMSAHPYAGGHTFPKDEQRPEDVNALFQVEHPGFVPTYTANLPEYFGTLMQTETVLRDMGPVPTPIGSTQHGRNTRVIDGKVAPCPVWFTEIGFAPEENGIKDRDAALAIKAKTAARYECLYINKGLERIYFFAACARDTWLGVVRDNFRAYAKTHTEYPADDGPYLSPMLRTVRRIVDAMKEGIDAKLTKGRPISAASITDTHDHFQFEGDGTPAHPTLYNRDVFAVLPFQVNARKFVIPYYVMTRDVTKPLAPEQYTVRLTGLCGKGAVITVMDPVTGAGVPVRVVASGPSSLTVLLTATDYPCLLVVRERKK